MQVSDARLTRLTLQRCTWGSKLENVLRIGSQPGPWIPQATSVAKDKVPQVTRVTIRVTAPEDVRIHCKIPQSM